LLFGYMVYVTRRIVTLADREPAARSVLGGYLTAAGWAFAIELFAMGTSGADISSPHLWVVWGLVATIGQYTWATSQQFNELEDSQMERVGPPARSGALVFLHPESRVV
jgi:hypothetical protein